MDNNIKNDYIRNDYIKNDYIKNDYIRNDYTLDDILNSFSDNHKLLDINDIETKYKKKYKKKLKKYMFVNPYTMSKNICIGDTIRYSKSIDKISAAGKIVKLLRNDDGTIKYLILRSIPYERTWRIYPERYYIFLYDKSYSLLDEELELKGKTKKSELERLRNKINKINNKTLLDDKNIYNSKLFKMKNIDYNPDLDKKILEILEIKNKNINLLDDDSSSNYDSSDSSINLLEDDISKSDMKKINEMIKKFRKKK
jgi:hypothetical protein